MGRAGRPGRPGTSRAAAPRRRSRRPRRRLPAERAGNDRRLPRHGQPRRDLDELRARVRRAGGARPVRADRSEGAARRRRLSVRHPRHRSPQSRCKPIRDGLPSLRATVALPYLGGEIAARHDPLERPRRRAGTVEFEQVAADHPLYVLYSSGTTGMPKPIVHGHGGILLEHLKVLGLHADLGPADRFFWFTTTGWMMWNYLVSGLLTGATIVTFDGDPATPDARRVVGASPQTPRSRGSGRARRTTWRAARQGCRPGEQLRPVAAARGRLDRRAAAGRRIPLDLRQASRQT